MVEIYSLTDPNSQKIRYIKIVDKLRAAAIKYPEYYGNRLNLEYRA